MAHYVNFQPETDPVALAQFQSQGHDHKKSYIEMKNKLNIASNILRNRSLETNKAAFHFK